MKFPLFNLKSAASLKLWRIRKPIGGSAVQSRSWMRFSLSSLALTKKLPKMVFLLLFFIFYFLFFIFFKAYALTMSNSTYEVIQGTLQSVAGTSANSTANRKLDISIGELGVGLYTGANYKVWSGFEYVHSLRHFSFSISPTTIDFGILSPTSLTTRTSTLTVNNDSANGYNVTASENHQLLSQSNGSIIPNATCDNGLCTDSTSDVWVNSLTFGFGYSCHVLQTAYCGNGLGSIDHFKQFTNTSISSKPQIVMSGKVGRDQQTTITYQVNISGSQRAGLYTNTITYVATPTF